MKKFFVALTLVTSFFVFADAASAADACPDLSGDWQCTDSQNRQVMWQSFHEHFAYYPGYNMYYWDGSVLYANGVPYSPCGQYMNTITMSCQNGVLNYVFHHREKLTEELAKFNELKFSLSADKSTMTIEGYRAIGEGPNGYVFGPTHATCVRRSR